VNARSTVVLRLAGPHKKSVTIVEHEIETARDQYMRRQWTNQDGTIVNQGGTFSASCFIPDYGIQRYYVVSGRCDGDDEDVTHVLRAVDKADAMHQFVVRLKPGLRGKVIDPLDDTCGEEESGVYINSVVSSLYPIEAE
jgi:hypothetical protein